ncbi:MAG: Maf family protein [Kineosporiaceae bacterium]
MTVLVLASASTGRRDTLIRAGVRPVVVVSTVDEDAVVARYGVTDPAEIALVLARAKAEDVADGDDLPGDGVVLGCDSVLALDGAVHGKPADAGQARRRWREMRGRSGVLHTGHWVVDLRADGRGGAVGATASTTVHFADLDDDEIDAYIATGEPLRVAGAFTVDGFGGPFITGIEGDQHAVVGVSLPVLRTLLRELGVPWPSLWNGTERVREHGGPGQAAT